MKILVISKERSLTRNVKRLSRRTDTTVCEAGSAADAIENLTSAENFDLVIISMASVWCGSHKWKEIIKLCGRRRPCIFIPDVGQITAISSVIMNHHVVCPLDTPAGKKIFMMLITGAVRHHRRQEKFGTNTTLVTNGIEGVNQTQPHFTRRQKEVLELMVTGKTNREIAIELNVAEGTVKLHSLSIYRSLGVSNRVQAVLRGQQLANDSCVNQ